MKKLFYALLICTAMFFSGMRCFAESSKLTPHLIIQYGSGDTSIFPITEELSFDVVDQALTLPGSEESIVDINEVHSLGIAYMLVTEKVDPLIEQTDEAWSIYRLDGTLVKSGRNKLPDINALRAGEVYIINLGNNLFKFIPLK